MKRMLNKTEADAAGIVERMRLVRTAGYKHVVELQGDAKRLVDWKEYVRAKPILSIAAASLLGFGLVRNTVFAVSKTTPARLTSGDPTLEAKSFRSTMGSSVATLATTIVSNAIRSYIANMMQRGNAKEDSNDRFRSDNP